MRMRDNLELLRTRTGRRALLRALRRRLYSRRVAIGIHRDLTQPYPTPSAQVPLQVRRLQPGDDLAFIAEDPQLDPERSRQRADQRWLLQSGLPTPWVALDPDGTVCFVTWLLTAQDNTALEAAMGPLLPPLAPGEVAIEGSFTAETHRGLGILPEIATRLVEQARDDDGARRARAFIAEWNASSLKAGAKAGWIPFARREETWILFRRRIRFLPWESEAA